MTKIRRHCRTMTAPLRRSKHELEPNHPTPERVAVRYRTTLEVVELFPDGVDLYLDEPVQRPVDAERQGVIPARINRLRTGIAQRFIQARRRAVEPHALE